ncbi:hypothetical protein ACFQZ2_01690 [Streptomonospora algeriensis]|uniref:Uncharacterized protein n=1 Tax=Streptomonospora algeriensis TaxID=995084 RepID=A0ABW3BBE6_9ACTN
MRGTSSEYMPSITVAALDLIVDLSDIQARGRLQANPDLVEHRLVLVEAMTREIRSAVESERSEEPPRTDQADTVSAATQEGTA